MAHIGQSKLYGITPAEGPQGCFPRLDHIRLEWFQSRRAEC